MVPRDRIRINRSVSQDDGAGGRKKATETEILNCLAEVKEVQASGKLEDLQQKLKQVIRVKFWKRAGVSLLAGDVLIWKGSSYTLQGEDVAEDFRNVIRVVTAIRQ